MRYWHVQTVVSEYSCPVQMVSEILGEITATDIFKANFEDIRDLEEYCGIVQRVCKDARFSKLKKLKFNFERT